MKERPIIFSAPMVRAILDGRKTQTRRIVKPQPFFSGGMIRMNLVIKLGNKKIPISKMGPNNIINSKHGDVGDRLWVKETWWRDPEDGMMIYRADQNENCRNLKSEKRLSGLARYSWKPSIFMPRWASRITLEITRIKVRQLQDISEEDAKSEGIQPLLGQKNEPGCWYSAESIETQGHARTAKLAFSKLWDSIHGDGAWDLNPWVWIIEFKVLEPK